MVKIQIKFGITPNLLYIRSTITVQNKYSTNETYN